MPKRTLSLKRQYELCLKDFQEKFFTLLLNDLIPVKAVGLEKGVFRAIEQIIDQAIDLAARLDEWGIFRRKYVESLGEFKAAFFAWHHAKIGEPKERAWLRLRKVNRSMFRRFLVQMKEIESDEEVFRDLEKKLYVLRDVQIQAFHFRGQELCLEHLAAFPLLTGLLVRYKIA